MILAHYGGAWIIAMPAPLSLLLEFGGLKPLPLAHLRHLLLVDERQDRLLEGEFDLLVFLGAVLGALGREPAGVHEILERGRVAPIGDAQRVVQALARCPMLV